MSCLKAVIRLKRGIVVDNRMIEKRRIISEMEDTIDESSKEVKERSNVAKNAWNLAVQSGKEIREKELLDYHHEEKLGGDEKKQQKRKEII